MGTRNLTIVYESGEYRLAQYCQWDGYPSSQGLTVLEFLRDKFDRSAFVRNLRACHAVDGDEIKARYASVGADGSGWVNMEVSKKFRDRWPTLDRDMGAEVLAAVQSAPQDLLLDLNFAGDSLMCEWAYVVDLDAKTLEVFRGFNQEPLTSADRFHALTCRDGYHPVKLAAVWPLEALPSNAEFLAALTKDDEEAA